MSQHTKPVLSIGIIFRDNIRSIERCLKALEPLREAIPCELVMADTGSVDGSRAVAEQYADILFDFPWINDFAAARNAVIDRCSGEWYITVDSDEYLDEDISELLGFLRTADPSANLALVNIRNYGTYEMDGAYSDFHTLRMVRTSTGLRYNGKIHEAWPVTDRLGPKVKLTHTIFHHDGYVGMSKNKEKLERNISLLRQKLQDDPQNLLVRLQFIESGVEEEDFLKQLRRAVALVGRKVVGWKKFGPPIMRHAVVAAKKNELPEFEDWVDRARKWFPDSYYTRIDVNGQCLSAAYDEKNYAASIPQGEALMEAYDDLRAERGDMDGLMYSTVQLGSPFHEQTFRLLLAASYLEEALYEKALACLERVDYTALDGGLTANLVKALYTLQTKSDLDTRRLVLSAWEGITTPKPSERRMAERRGMFILTGSGYFTPAHRESEEQEDRRRAYTLFSPLVGECGLGTAAAILESENPAEIAALLRQVDNWRLLPFPALSHAILTGTQFPLPAKPMDMEELDALAQRLSGDGGTLRRVLGKYAAENFSANWQTLTWTCALALTSVQGCGWKDEKADMELARIFVKVEREFLKAYYSQELLREENIHILPSMHRFGWYCIQAFEALEAGDAAGYARSLRKGLASGRNMKAMVEFLLDCTPALQTTPQPDQELMELAEKVRTMLAAFSPDDPAVLMLKQSAAYQKVAYLVEGLETPVMGGLAQ